MPSAFVPPSAPPMASTSTAPFPPPALFIPTPQIPHSRSVSHETF